MTTPYNLVLSPEAETDLQEIWLYIAKDSRDLDIADRFHEQLINFCFDQIALFPEAGSPRDELLSGLRLRIYKERNIYYMFNGEKVTIYRILRGQQDIENTI